jgi:acyl-CoA synthetase (NDP forming)
VTAPEAVAAAIAESAAGSNRKPVLANFMSAKGAPEILANIPSYSFPEAAATALSRVTAYGEWRRRPLGTVPVFDDIDADKASSIIEQALARGGGWLSPVEAQGVLAAAGIAVAKTRLTANRDDLISAAREVGFPVALKAVGPSILHKTEVGGVALNLADEAALKGVYDEMAERLGSQLTGAIVQEMVPRGVEVIIGATLDTTFGPLVMYGSGGILVEMLNDVAFCINPLTDADVEGMMQRVKGTALLRGYRGSPPADEAALRDIILRVSALVVACPQIQEMDLNPVTVLRKGALVIDARLKVDRLPEPTPTRRITY